jgi:TatD DNase family protein
MQFYDAHNHWQDPHLEKLPLAATLQLHQIAGVVINGTSVNDWDEVLRLASSCKRVVPSIGLHPWQLLSAPAAWETTLENFVRKEQVALGEIGLDRWKEPYDCEKQERAFRFQLQLAKQCDRPVSIHCLRAWGQLLEVLRHEQLSPGRFLIHSFGGSKEMLRELLDLGAYVSLSPYFFQQRKRAQLELLLSVPLDHLLLETDAPDMAGPIELFPHRLPETQADKHLNHPANIVPLYQAVAAALKMDLPSLAMKVERNFLNLFSFR